MTKAGFWKEDWFLCLGVSLVMLATGGTQLIEALERFAYDWGVRASARTPSDKISVIAIDKRSIDNIGRWPWSREIHAKMIERLADAKAKVIGYTVFFSEPQLDPGLAYDCGFRVREAFDHLCMDLARPRPATDIVDAALVDRDHGDLVGGGSRRGPDAPVVREALEGLDQLGPAGREHHERHPQTEKPVFFPEARFG